jgi:hypothetical protein
MLFVMIAGICTLIRYAYNFLCGLWLIIKILHFWVETVETYTIAVTLREHMFYQFLFEVFIILAYKKIVFRYLFVSQIIRNLMEIFYSLMLITK